MKYHEIVESGCLQEAALPGVKPRYAEFTDGDLQYYSGRFDTAEAFAERLVNPASAHSDLARQVMISRWRQWDQEGVRGTEPGPVDPLSGAPPLARHIAQAIGATGYRKAGHTEHPPWRKEMMFSPECYFLATPEGSVFLDATVIRQGREIGLSQISVENLGSGLGSRVMEAIREYAVEHGCGVAVYKVTNRKFFSRFGWLRPGNSYGDYFVSTF